MFVYKLGGFGFKCCASNLILRFRETLKKDLLSIQATRECGFTLKCVCNMIRRYSSMHGIDKYSQHSSLIWAIWLSNWAFIFELYDCGFESRSSHLKFRFRVGYEEWVPWHSGNYRIMIDSEMCRWNDQFTKNFLWFQVLLQSLKLLISRLFQAKGFSTFRQL